MERRRRRRIAGDMNEAEYVSIEEECARCAPCPNGVVPMGDHHKRQKKRDENSPTSRPKSSTRVKSTGLRKAEVCVLCEPTWAGGGQAGPHGLFAMERDDTGMWVSEACWLARQVKAVLETLEQDDDGPDCSILRVSQEQGEGKKSPRTTIWRCQR
ncbi:hypothetical protein HMN09_00237600 [Mycena chlorophos]|uniref:Uncharacterized protein n=1 Tax=Mycena chlorophos TaxID=658473 RepID=A0A8H6WNR4_MYCCL|nr:hypothetical protein HMN09_00237600 [Mycena chlorophos]